LNPYASYGASTSICYRSLLTCEILGVFYHLEVAEDRRKPTSGIRWDTLALCTRREIGVIAKAWGRARPEARREIVRHLATASVLLLAMESDDGVVNVGEKQRRGRVSLRTNI